MKLFKCPIHTNVLNRVCIDPECPQKGLICDLCLNTSHSAHHTSLFEEYILSQKKQKQVTDADVIRLKEIYSQSVNILNNVKIQFQRAITQFEQFINDHFQQESKFMEKSRVDQLNQAKLITNIEKANYLQPQIDQIVQLINFNNLNRIEDNFDIIKNKFTRINQVQSNILQETPKIVKDLEMYFARLQSYLSNQGSSISTQKKNIESSIINNQQDATFGFQGKQDQMSLLSMRNEDWLSRREDSRGDYVEDERAGGIQLYKHNQNIQKEKNSLSIYNTTIKSRIQQKYVRHDPTYDTNSNLKQLLNLSDDQVKKSDKRLVESQRLSPNLSADKHSSSHNAYQKPYQSEIKPRNQNLEFNFINLESSQSQIPLDNLGSSQKMYGSGIKKQQQQPQKEQADTKIKIDTQVEIINPTESQDSIQLQNQTKIKANEGMIEDVLIIDQNTIATTKDSSVKLWDIAKKKQIDKFNMKKMISKLYQFSDKNQVFLVAGCGDGSSQIWQKQKKWTKIATFQIFNCSITVIKFIPQQNNKLYYCSINGDFKAINWISGKEIFEAKNHENGVVSSPIYSILFIVTQSTLQLNLKIIMVGGRKSGQISIWSQFDQLQHDFSFQGHNKVIHQIQEFNQYFITSAQYDQEIKFWDMSSYQLCKIIKESGLLQDIFVLNESILLVGLHERSSGKGKIKFWNLNQFKVIKESEEFNSKPTKVIGMNNLISSIFLEGDLIVFNF